MNKIISALIIYCCTISNLFAQINYFNESGLKKYNNGQYEEAIKDFDIAINTNQNNYEFYYNRANAKYKLFRYSEAIQDCDKSISINSKFDRSYNSRGRAKYKLELYSEAINDFSQAILLNPNNDNYYLNRAYAESIIGEFEESVKDFDKALELNPNNSNSLLYRGFSKRMSGNCEEAIKDYEKALAIDSLNYDSFYQLGKCHYKLNNFLKANEYLNKYILLTKDTSSKTCFAKLYLGQKEIAFNEMEKFIKKSPDLENYFELAKLYGIIGETELAVKNLDIALAKGLNIYRAIYNDNFEYINYKPEFIALMKKYNITNLPYTISLSKIITNDVKVAILKWQYKGEFETTSAYIERMKTRENEIKKITLEVTNKLKDEFIQKINWNNIQIGKYDADAQTFSIMVESLNAIIIKIPLSDAPTFKQNFQKYKITYKDLVITNDSWIISELIISDPTGLKKYKYDIKNQPDYNPNKIFTLNFSALNINLNEYDDLYKQNHTKDYDPVLLGPSDVDIDIPFNQEVNNKTFAVIIANENYQKEVKVDYAGNDGKIFKEYCEKTLGIPLQNIHFIQDATYGNMKSEIKWITDIIAAFNGEANVIFYYAGHGMPNETDKSAYLLPIDGYSSDFETAIKLIDLYSKLAQTSTKSITIFLDACFSGSSRDDNMLANTRGVQIKPKNDQLLGNTVVFSACTGSETAFPYKEKQHGLFTYFLLKKLQETKGDVDYKTLSEYIIKNVKQQSIIFNQKSQTPQINSSNQLKNRLKSMRMK